MGKMPRIYLRPVQESGSGFPKGSLQSVAPVLIGGWLSLLGEDSVAESRSLRPKPQNACSIDSQHLFRHIRETVPLN